MTTAAKPTERGAVVGLMYFVNYNGLGIPVIALGVLAISTTLLRATQVAAVVLAVCCLGLLPVATLSGPITAGARVEVSSEIGPDQPSPLDDGEQLARAYARRVGQAS